eukprot:s2769_g1.t1
MRCTLPAAPACVGSIAKRIELRSAADPAKKRSKAGWRELASLRAQACALHPRLGTKVSCFLAGRAFATRGGKPDSQDPARRSGPVPQSLCPA